MNSSAPQVGFDRFIHLDWVVSALKFRAGQLSLDELSAQLETSGLGPEARTKTRTKLNGLWLVPREELADFAARGVGIFASNPEHVASALSWGMAIASYPFFGKVAELVGRLTSLHSICSSAEIHRRISESYGQREITKRATQAVLQTMTNWNCVERVDEGRRFVRSTPIVVSDDQLVSWLLESAIRYLGRSIAVESMNSVTAIFPFVLDRSLGHLIMNNEILEVRTEGMAGRSIALRHM
jgi:hypothetical protein